MGLLGIGRVREESRIGVRTVGGVEHSAELLAGLFQRPDESTCQVLDALQGGSLEPQQAQVFSNYSSHVCVCVPH